MTEETNMTEQEMEEATNPFPTSINVDANNDGVVTPKELDDAVTELAEIENSQDVSSDPITDTKDGIDTPVHGETALHISDELLDAIAEEDVVKMAELVVNPEFRDQIIHKMGLSEEGFESAKTQILQEAKVILDSRKEEAPKLDYPTKESLTKLIRPSANPNDLGYRQHWSIACQKFSDANDLHFLGFSIKNDEPMFKEKK